MRAFSGMISLQSLIEYARNEDPAGNSLLGNSAAGRLYGRMAKTVVETIPEESGLYVWGNYDRHGNWNHIYVGKSCKSKKAHLRARILEELKDEKHFLWRSVFSESELLAFGERNYTRMWFRYQNHWRLALLKTGATHILWVAAPTLDDQQICQTETALIALLNPIANRVRPLSVVGGGLPHQVLENLHAVIAQHAPVQRVVA